MLRHNIATASSIRFATAYIVTLTPCLGEDALRFSPIVTMLRRCHDIVMMLLYGERCDAMRRYTRAWRCAILARY